MHGTETSVIGTFTVPLLYKQQYLQLGVIVYSQMGDPSFAHSAGNCLHRRAQRVQQRCQLSGAFRLFALLHNEPGHGDHVGVEGSSFRHGGRWSSEA